MHEQGINGSIVSIEVARLARLAWVHLANRDQIHARAHQKVCVCVVLLAARWRALIADLRALCPVCAWMPVGRSLRLRRAKGGSLPDCFVTTYTLSVQSGLGDARVGPRLVNFFGGAV